MAREWRELTDLTRGSRFSVERVRLEDGETAIEGSFTPPPLSLLDAGDQLFVMAFVKSHGSIKEMERVFGISYPTVKARLNRIAEMLPLFELDVRSSVEDALEQLGRGEITVGEALERLGP